VLKVSDIAAMDEKAIITKVGELRKEMSVETATKKKLSGTVVSDVSNKTAVVSVVRRYKHPVYSKFIQKSKKYHVHDEENKLKIGDMVTIVESRPYSKKKRWEIYSQANA